MKPRHELAEWQRAQVDSGRTLRWLAEQTGKSYQTVVSYSIGRRQPSPEWQARVIELCQEPVAA